MAFDVSGLTNYVKENSDLLLVKSITGAKTASMMTVQTGIKSAEKLKIFETDAVFQAGGACGFNASGTTTISDRTITVGKIKVQEQLCVADLEAKATQLMLPAGSNYTAVPFEAAWTSRKIELINKQMEAAIWQGDTASGNANLARFDGALKIIAAAANEINGNTGGITVATGITGTNVKTIIEAQLAAIPNEIYTSDDLRTFVGWDVFRLLVGKLHDQNYFHYKPEVDGLGELIYPGTGIKIQAVPGLTGTSQMLTTKLSNFYLGTDLENEEEDFKVWYSEDDDLVKFSAKWKAGVQFMFTDQVVHFKLV